MGFVNEYKGPRDTGRWRKEGEKQLVDKKQRVGSRSQMMEKGLWIREGSQTRVEVEEVTLDEIYIENNIFFSYFKRKLFSFKILLFFTS